MIDYGMEQGRDVYENIRVPCAPSEIDYVFLTHAHIDHSGLLPLLYAGGFRGEIHATQATVSLCQIMLRDSAHIQEFEAEWRNRKAKRSGGDIYTPLYTMQEALGSLEHFVPHPYGEKISIADGITIRFWMLDICSDRPVLKFGWRKTVSVKSCSSLAISGTSISR